uniref:Rho guanine nucleotide exchange factor 37 n=1 Tax=Anser cygnoides TaxID=8845 RepID=A0A8B9DME5_ANSCY
MASPHTEEPPTKGTADPDAHIYEEVTLCERMELSQRLAVEELITTEASYVHNLQLCLSDIRAHLQQKQLPDFDLEGLFSNIDDILHLSRQFLRGLEATAAQEHDQLLGTLFQEFKEEMETVYKIYCASYEHALLLVPAAETTSSLSMVLQRITKYPLLLGKILENTPAGTSTHQALAAAVSAMAQANANINEYKRQREVATKYNKAEHLTLRDRLARLNTHSIAKKTTRLSRLLMHEAGFVSKTEDKEYDNLEEKFQSVASSVAGLKENVASYMAHLEAFLVPAPHKRELQMEEGPAQQYHRLAEHLHRAVFPEFKRRLDRLVWQPLCSLSEMLVGPQQLVKKRLDKLLDYEEIQERKSELGSVTYDEEAAMNTYLAINALLVAELPRFNQVAVQLLGQVLGSLCVLHQDLAAEVLHEAEKELKQLPHGHMPLPAFWRLVEDTLQQAGAQLRTFTQAFETVTPGPVTQPLTPAEERKVLSLVSKHGPDKLYQVTSNVSGSKDLDLTLQRGQIVALLQRVDTKGNTSRWLVDAGGPRGFVPAAKLQPYSPVQSQQPGMQTPTLENPALPVPSPLVSSSQQGLPHLLHLPQVVAGFSFAARSPQEVSLQAGQPVVVLEPHDKKGSTEWSLVEVNGQRGYVPSSYLVTVPVQEPMGWSLPV